MKSVYLWCCVGVMLLAYKASGQQLPDCNNWLHILDDNSTGVNCGDISITGQAITVEALICASAPFDGSNVRNIVSKHGNPEDCNFILRPDRAQITTIQSGHFMTPPVCYPEMQKIYHVAMTYNGKKLVFYRNGKKMSQIACSGDLMTNSYPMRIGTIASLYQKTIETFVGYIDEVRIWNIVRTEQEIKEYMNKALPNPVTLPGLVAYYHFNTLLNKQGSAQFNGSIDNDETIKSAAPSCEIGMDKCCGDPIAGNIIRTQPTTICPGQSVNMALQIPDPDPDTKYSWIPASGLSNAALPDPVAKPTENTVYKVTATLPNGCVLGNGEVEIKVYAQPSFSVSANQNICQGEEATLTASGGNSYVWKTAAGEQIGKGSSSIKVKPAQTASYAVDISTDYCGFHAEKGTTVNVNALPEIHIQKTNDIDCSNLEAQLIPTGALNYNWQTDPTLSVQDNGSAIASPNQTTQYKLWGTDGNGCRDTASVSVTVDPSAANYRFYVPNAFTPNGDGKNDYFRPVTNISFKKFQLRIFNRWGELLYQSNNSQQYWDGNYKGSLAPVGAYIYEIIATSNCGQIYKKGTLTLIR